MTGLWVHSHDEDDRIANCPAINRDESDTVDLLNPGAFLVEKYDFFYLVRYCIFNILDVFCNKFVCSFIPSN